MPVRVGLTKKRLLKSFPYIPREEGSGGVGGGLVRWGGGWLGQGGGLGGEGVVRSRGLVRWGGGWLGGEGVG